MAAEEIPVEAGYVLLLGSLQNLSTDYVVRHGDVEYSIDKQGNKLMYSTDTPLSAEGRSQIEALACRFQREGITFDVIYSSPHR